MYEYDEYNPKKKDEYEETEQESLRVRERIHPYR